MQKCLILGFDGLEYDLVEEFDLKNLKQKEYGKTDISHYPAAYTPLLWGSFLTGRNVSEDYKISLKYDAALRFMLNSIKKAVPSLYNEMGKRYYRYSKNKRIKRLISPGIIGIWGFNARKEKTIFDLFERPKIIEFITYTVHITSENRKPIRMYFLLKELDDDNFEEYVWGIRFDRVVSELFKSLTNEGYDLIAVYLNELDYIGHVFRGDLQIMERNYRKFDEVVGRVKEIFDGTILIFSDHGMKQLGRFGDHLHVDHGFYSCNRNLNLNNPKPEDFYHIVKEIRQSD